MCQVPLLLEPFKSFGSIRSFFGVLYSGVEHANGLFNVRATNRTHAAQRPPVEAPG